MVYCVGWTLTWTMAWFLIFQPGLLVSPEGAKATGISTYDEAVKATRINNDYWMKHRTGACKFLNVLQGENHADAEDWYQQMKDYCDPNHVS
jgi:hypothetical protein